MSGPSVTRIVEVIDALVELITVAAPGVDVVDGARIGEVLSEALCVGFSASPETPGYETETRRQEGLGRPRLVEDFTVRCFLVVSSGSVDLAPLRARAAEVLGQIDTALRDSVHNEGVWDRAGLGGTAEWVPFVDGTGGLCNVFFSIVGTSLL